MRNKGDIKNSAKKLFSFSFVNGTLDEGRVLEIVKILIKNQGTHTKAILGSYKTRLSRYIKAQTLVLEVPKGYRANTDEIQNMKKKAQAQYVELVENEKIIVGARITHGDWVYDQTLDAQLTELTNSL